MLSKEFQESIYWGPEPHNTDGTVPKEVLYGTIILDIIFMLVQMTPPKTAWACSLQ